MSKGSMADRLRMRLNREEGLKKLDQVVLDHGYVEGEPYSYKDHEYQIEIMKDTSQRMGVRKCSQVGLSELMVQKALAILASIPNIRVIFSLPTKEMAMIFSKDRFDGAIDASDHYKGMISPGDNSAGYKKIGSSSLYVIGTFGSKSAISVPAEFIISDEIDFSNDVVLGKLDSRIRHAKTEDAHGNRGYRYRFSTPTVEGYGVDLEFQKGDQRYYMCRCEHCEKWTLPDYFKDFVIPNFTKSIDEFTKDDLQNPRYASDKTWIKCPECGKNLFNSLCDPERRQWVAKFPSATDRSYQVFPWDVPRYNAPHVIMKSMEGYPLKSDFINFVIGLPYSDAENTFLNDAATRVRLCTVTEWIFGTHIVTAPTVGGMDVGKICHLTVRVRVGTKHHVIAMEKITNSKTTPAAPQVLARYDFYNMKKLCIDAGPDITLVNTLVAARENICSVVYTSVQGPMPITEKFAGDVINADRTRTLTLLMTQHNGGDILYVSNDAKSHELMEHFKTTKKIRERNADGDMKEKFVRTPGADHWVHSLNYSGIAMLALELLDAEPEAASMPMVGTVKLGSGVEDVYAMSQEESNSLEGLFGVGSAAARGRRR